MAKESINKAGGIALIQVICLFIGAIIPIVGWFVIVPIVYIVFIVLNILAVVKAYKV